MLVPCRPKIGLLGETGLLGERGLLGDCGLLGECGRPGEDRPDSDKGKTGLPSESGKFNRSSPETVDLGDDTPSACETIRPGDTSPGDTSLGELARSGENVLPERGVLNLATSHTEGGPLCILFTWERACGTGLE